MTVHQPECSFFVLVRVYTRTRTQHRHIFVLCVRVSICMFCVHVLASVLPKVNVPFGLVKMFSGVMEQVARHTPNCRRHYVTLAVAEFFLVFNFLVTHWPNLFSHSPSCIPSPHSSLPFDFSPSLPSVISMWLSTWS